MSYGNNDFHPPTTDQVTISSTETSTDSTTISTTETDKESTTLSSTTVESTTVTLITESTTLTPTTESTTLTPTTESTTFVSTTESTTLTPTTESTTLTPTTESTTLTPTTESTTLTSTPTTESTTLTPTTESTTQTPTTESTTLTSSPTTESTTLTPTTESTTLTPTTESTTLTPTTESTTLTPTTEGTTYSSTLITTESITTEVTTVPSGETTTASCPIGQLEGDQVALVCPTGFRRHPKYCNLFYQCTTNRDTYEMKVVVLSCPDNTLFDEKKVQCLPAAETRPCSGEFANRRMYRRLEENSLPPIPVSGGRSLCPRQGNNVLTDDCNSMYVKCSKDSEYSKMQGYLYQCPSGYTYYPVSNLCERTARLPECKGLVDPQTQTRWDVQIDRESVSMYKKRRGLHLFD